MPAWILRFLPHALVVAAVLGAMAWLDHRGYQRARDDAAHERLINEAAIQQARRDIEGAVARQIASLDRGLHDQIAGIERVDRTIVQPTITKELTRETRYADPAAGVSVQLLDALNIGRASSACAARPDGGIVCTLPEPVADPRPGDRADSDDDG